MLPALAAAWLLTVAAPSSAAASTSAAAPAPPSATTTAPASASATTPAPAPASAASTPAPATAADPSACPATLPGLGLADAAVQLRWFFDPVVPGALEMWLELRRLIGDQPALVAVTPIVVASATHSEREEALVRRWLTGAAEAGHLEGALRALEREGPARLALRLARPESRAALAREAGIPASASESPCAAALIRAGSDEFRERLRHSQGRAGRPPAFAIGPYGAFEDGARLDGVRREIELVLRESWLERPTFAAGRRRGVSERLIRPPAGAGMIVGGVGLAHRLVIFAEQEDHPNFLLLGPALALRSARPGILAIQVIARGANQQASRLRLRLCAAEHLGRQLEYLRVLAREIAVDTVAGRALLGRLDEVADERGCADTEFDLSAAADGSRSLPEGLWLDGAAVNQRQLVGLENEILRIDATRSPLDAVFSAAAPPEP